MDVVNGITLVCGIFILYQTFMMKKEKRIPEGVFVTKGTVIASDADVEGFINYVCKKSILLGILGCLSGIGGLLEESYPRYSILYSGISIAFMVWLVVFMVVIRKAQKKYLRAV